MTKQEYQALILRQFKDYNSLAYILMYRRDMQRGDRTEQYKPKLRVLVPEHEINALVELVKVDNGRPLFQISFGNYDPSASYDEPVEILGKSEEIGNYAIEDIRFKKDIIEFGIIGFRLIFKNGHFKTARAKKSHIIKYDIKTRKFLNEDKLNEETLEWWAERRDISIVSNVKLVYVDYVLYPRDELNLIRFLHKNKVNPEHFDIIMDIVNVYGSKLPGKVSMMYHIVNQLSKLRRQLQLDEDK